jgi:hypothetical protein
MIRLIRHFMYWLVWHQHVCRFPSSSDALSSILKVSVNFSEFIGQTATALKPHIVSQRGAVKQALLRCSATPYCVIFSCALHFSYILQSIKSSFEGARKTSDQVAVNDDNWDDIETRTIQLSLQQIANRFGKKCYMQYGGNGVWQSLEWRH